MSQSALYELSLSRLSSDEAHIALNKQFDVFRSRGLRLVERFDEMTPAVMPSSFVAPFAGIAGRCAGLGIFIVAFADAVGECHAGWLPIRDVLTSNPHLGPDGRSAAFRDSNDTPSTHPLRSWLPSLQRIGEAARERSYTLTSLFLKMFPDTISLRDSRTLGSDDLRTIERHTDAEVRVFRRELEAALKFSDAVACSDEGPTARLTGELSDVFRRELSTYVESHFTGMRLTVAHHLYETFPPSGPIAELLDEVNEIAMRRGAAAVKCEAYRSACELRRLDTTIADPFVSRAVDDVIDRSGKLNELWDALTCNEREGLLTDASERVCREAKASYVLSN